MIDIPEMQFIVGITCLFFGFLMGAFFMAMIQVTNRRRDYMRGKADGYLEACTGLKSYDATQSRAVREQQKKTVSKLHQQYLRRAK